MRPPGRKSGEQKTARQGVRRTRKVVQGESAAAVGGALRFARPFGGALAPLGSPPWRLPVQNLFGRGVLPHRLWGKRRDPVFKPQGNSIIPKRKFVTTFQKKRAPAGAPFCARRSAKEMSKKRYGRVYAGRGKRRGGWAAFLLFFLRANYAHIFALRTISAALSLRSVRRRSAWLCPTIRVRGFCRACFF